MTLSILPYRPRNPTLSVGSQALNPQQRRDFANYTNRMRGQRRFIPPRLSISRGRVRTLYKRKYSRSRNGVLGGTQSDTRLIYNKKRMPRKKRKRWASFVRKVNAVDEKDLGTRTVLFNDQINQQTVSVSQATLTLGLYTFLNGTYSHLNDMNQIGSFENTSVAPDPLKGINVDRSTKIMFHSAVMDVTIRNTCKKYVEVGDPQLSAEAAIELDVYDIVFKEDTTDTTFSYSSLNGVLNALDDKEIGGTGTGINLNDRGATPFEFPTTLSHFKLKVLKKTKFFIPNGQTITFQVRNPKRKVISYGDLTNNTGWNRPGWSVYKLLVYKLVPGCIVGSLPGNFKLELDVGCTRKYMYKLEGANDNRERLITSSQTVTGSA